MSPTKDSLTSDVIGRNEKQGGRAFHRREFGVRALRALHFLVLFE